jgi:hypothetical protein
MATRRVRDLSHRAKIRRDIRENNPAKKVWQEPTLEDVSERIMAQPYIRFT